MKGSLYFFTKLCEKFCNQPSNKGLFLCVLLSMLVFFVVLFILLRSAIYSFIYFVAVDFPRTETENVRLQQNGMIFDLRPLTFAL